MSRPEVGELVEEITSYINTLSLDPDEFTKEMGKQHRTLQQSFTRLCLAWIETCASDDYRYDARNESSHEVCKMMVEAFMKSNDIANLSPSNFLPVI